MDRQSDNWLILNFNLFGALLSLGMLALSLWLAEVNLATKGYWAMGILMLSISLINVVKYRFDWRSSEDRIRRIEEARNEKLLEEFVGEVK